MVQLDIQWYGILYLPTQCQPGKRGCQELLHIYVASCFFVFFMYSYWEDESLTEG